MNEREQWLADTFVDIADTLVADFDLLEVLTVMVERCVTLLDAAEVGLVLRGPGGRLSVMASSTERMRAVELFEVQSDDGPCLDCLRSAAAVEGVLLDADAVRRWPRFTPMAREAGYQAVLALPMRIRSRAIGAVNVFLAHEQLPVAGDIRLTQAIADAATIAILQQRMLRESTEVVTQLQTALNTRVTLEQAKGMVAEQLGIDVTDAFQRIRTHARNHNLTIAQVAQAVTGRELIV